MLQVWVDTGLVPAVDARVSVFDRGFRSGEGVFETFRAYGGHVFRLDAHLARATAGAAVVGFELDGDRLREAVSATAAANLAELGGADSALRLTATPGSIEADSPFPGVGDGRPTVVVTSHRLRGDETTGRAGARAIVVPGARTTPSVKALSYLSATLARRQARARGADEALLTDVHGRVLEGSSSNVFAVVDGVLVTPPVEAGLLAGVTRGVVLELAAAAGIATEQRPVSVPELLAADEAFLTATTRELTPLVGVDDRSVGSGVPGPVTTGLQEAYRAEVRREAQAR